MIFQKNNQEENNLNYQLKKIMHMIQLQIMDIQSTLHYIQKKHTLHQIKEILSQIYNIFNQTQVVFKHCKAIFLHTSVKKLMNFFGLIYFMLTDNSENGKMLKKEVLFTDKNKKENLEADQSNSKQKFKKQAPKTQKNVSSNVEVNHRPLGGIYLYNQNYRRHVLSNAETKQKNSKCQLKNNLTKDEFKKQIMDQLNENYLSMPHPDEIIDIFTFKFKYGREKQVVTFHDQLQSIAKFFKDSQNQAFQFLNKTKDQNANLTYNDTFSDIMRQVKLQKEIKLQQFTKKIKNAFSSIKSKTQTKWNEIQNKLEEVKEIKNSINPPQIRDQATQTSYNVDEQLRYLNKKIESAEQKYKLMHEMKKEEIEQNTIMQIQMESQLSLKARQLVYLKIALEENKTMINTLNKRIKAFTDNHKKIKQTISLSANSKEAGIKQLAEIVDAEEIQSERASEQQNLLNTLRKQKKIAKKMIADARSRRSLVEQKQTFVKRYTQQLQGLTLASKDILEKWGLSQISQQADMQTLSIDHSVATNKNIQLTRQSIRKNTRTIVSVKQAQNVSVRNSNHSIRSVAQQNRSGKQSRQKTKTNSQFFSVSRPSLSKERKKQNNSRQNYNNDSLFDQSDSSSQIQSNAEKNEYNLKRIEEMYKRQMNKAKNNIIQRKTVILSQLNRRTLLKSKFKTDESQSKKSVSSKLEHSSPKNSLYQNKTTGNSSINLKYIDNSVRLSSTLNQMNSIDERQEEKDLHREIKDLQSKHKQLQGLLDKKSRLSFVVCHKQVNLFIEPGFDKKVEQAKQFIKVKSEIEEEANDTDLKTDKKYNFKNTKDKKKIHYKENKAGTQPILRQITQIGSFKQCSQSIGGKNELHNQKSKTLYVQRSQLNFQDNFKKENKQQISKLSSKKSSNKDLQQKYKTLETQKRSQIQKKNSNLIKKINFSQKQNKNSLLQFKRTAPDSIGQNFDQELQKKQEQEQYKKIGQLASSCKTKKQFKQKINQIHQQKCGKTCKHLQQYMNNFGKYKEETKAKLTMHVQNLNSLIDSPAQLPMLNKKK